MFYIETKITIHLKKDIPFVHANEALTKNISLVMLNHPYLKSVHGQTGGFKPYVFSLPYPPEVKTKVYEAGRVYVFTLRSVDEKFSDLLMRELQAHKGLDFTVLSTQKRKVQPFYIDTLHTISPAVLTHKTEKGKNLHWRLDDGDIMMVKERIIANLEKKYKFFYGEQLTAPDAITYFEILNKVPYPIKYKGKTFQSNKFRLGFDSDEASQKLAFTAMSLGILEKNALGFGFCIGREVKALRGLVR